MFSLACMIESHMRLTLSAFPLPTWSPCMQACMQRTSLTQAVAYETAYTVEVQPPTFAGMPWPCKLVDNQPERCRMHNAPPENDAKV